MSKNPVVIIEVTVNHGEGLCPQSTIYCRVDTQRQHNIGTGAANMNTMMPYNIAHFALDQEPSRKILRRHYGCAEAESCTGPEGSHSLLFGPSVDPSELPVGATVIDIP